MEPQVNCRLHKSRKLSSTLDQFNPINTLKTICLRSIQYNNAPPPVRTCLVCIILPPSFQTKIMNEFLIASLRATFHTHHIFLDLITCAFG